MPVLSACGIWVRSSSRISENNGNPPALPGDFHYSLDNCIKTHYNNLVYRGVAKFGIALGSGPRGRGFESRHSDQRLLPDFLGSPGVLFCLCGIMFVESSVCCSRPFRFPLFFPLCGSEWRFSCLEWWREPVKMGTAAGAGGGISWHNQTERVSLWGAATAYKPRRAAKISGGSLPCPAPALLRGLACAVPGCPPGGGT